MDGEEMKPLGEQMKLEHASSTVRRPAAPTPLSWKRYKKLGTVIKSISIANYLSIK
jgi:hypothetical protein